jgi:hypothetical protein
MSEPVVLLETIDSVTRLTLNRPKAMNSLNLAIVNELERHLVALAADDTVRVVVLTGAGPAFCAGADLKEVLASQNLPAGEADFLDRGEALYSRLRNFPKPVIAALNGVTMAGGLELAMCADIVVAAESATIGDAHANFGVYPGAGGAAVLPRLIPAEHGDVSAVHRQDAVGRTNEGLRPGVRGASRWRIGRGGDEAGQGHRQKEPDCLAAHEGSRARLQRQVTRRRLAA